MHAVPASPDGHAITTLERESTLQKVANNYICSRGRSISVSFVMALKDCLSFYHRRILVYCYEENCV